MAQLIVDSREADVMTELSKKNIPYTSKSLDIGDFQIIKDNKVLAIWERKTYSDLASSIDDGRYREQKHRITTSDARYKGYIVEGHCPTGQYGRLQPGTIDSIRLGLICRDGFLLISSNESRHTAMILSKMLKKIPEYIDAEPERTKEFLENQYHCALVQSSVSGVKKENLTPETCYLAQLAQIPQVSYHIAKAIQTIYPNISSLVTAINLNRDTALHTLSEIKCNSRRIGVSVATKICLYLVPPKSQVKIVKKS
jgi:ERCC4-type nuclease